MKGIREKSGENPQNVGFIIVVGVMIAPHSLLGLAHPLADPLFLAVMQEWEALTSLSS